jgi:hypothetical protein
VEPDPGAATKVSPVIFVWARYELISRFRQRVMWHKRINELGLSEYAERFAENEIDVAVLPLLIA